MLALRSRVANPARPIRSSQSPVGEHSQHSCTMVYLCGLWAVGYYRCPCPPHRQVIIIHMLPGQRKYVHRAACPYASFQEQCTRRTQQQQLVLSLRFSRRVLTVGPFMSQPSDIAQRKGRVCQYFGSGGGLPRKSGKNDP